MAAKKFYTVNFVLELQSLAGHKNASPCVRTGIFELATILARDSLGLFLQATGCSLRTFSRSSASWCSSTIVEGRASSRTSSIVFT